MYVSMSFDKCIRSCNHRHNLNVESSPPPHPPHHNSLAPLPSQLLFPHSSFGLNWVVFWRYNFAFSRMFCVLYCTYNMWPFESGFFHFAFIHDVAYQNWFHRVAECLHYIHVPQLICPLTSWRSCGFFLVFGSHE